MCSYLDITHCRECFIARGKALAAGRREVFVQFIPRGVFKVCVVIQATAVDLREREGW